MTDEEIVAALAAALDDTATGIYMRQHGDGWGRTVAAAILPTVRALMDTPPAADVTR